MFLYVVTFADTVANGVNVVPSGDRSMANPVSFDALSVQARLIWVLDTAVAVRLAGAAGAVPVVCALATFDHADGPTPLVALTR